LLNFNIFKKKKRFFFLKKFFFLNNNYLFDFFYKELFNFNLISIFYINFFNGFDVFDNNYHNQYSEENIFFEEDNFFKNSLNFNNNNLLFYNNYYPLILNNYIFTKFFREKKYFKKNNFFSFYNYYILNFLEFFFKNLIFLKIDTNLFLNNSNNFKEIVYDHVEKNNLFNLFDLNEFVDIISYSLEFKDLTILNNFLQKILIKITLLNHKKFILFFEKFISRNWLIISQLYNITGFFFKIKGKINLLGNAKKKKMFFKLGKLNLSNKNLKLDSKLNIVKTHSGTLGFIIILSYN